MGIEVQSLRLLLLARELGCDFTRSLTIGQQRLMFNRTQAQQAFRERGLTADEALLEAIGDQNACFAAPLMRKLGASSVDALDISAFEGASVIHDLNQALPPEHHARFSLVFDGGTLEHVFDVATAIKSLMSLPERNGHLIIAVPANNDMGHGFFQFSPEIFFRTLTPDNGYSIKLVAVAPLFTFRNWNLARDPRTVGARVGYPGGSVPLYCFAIAQRTQVTDVFARTPQQADYAMEWEAFDATAEQKLLEVGPRGMRAFLHRVTPTPLADLAREARMALRSGAPDTFAKFDPARQGAGAVQRYFAAN